ncbi:glycosyltransferase family 4 protein [Novosphingobium sp.]|uniref:glycosyltransferase family 4 protein n=1 Tax=Novosphingobium sp. TaxID=1874826 RepID=UPI003B52D0AD
MASARKPVRLAIVVSHPIQYYVPLYRELARDPDIDLKVFYFSDLSIRGGFDEGFGGEVRWDIDLMSGYDSEFVGKHYATNHVSGFMASNEPAIFGKIARGRFDAVLLSGYGLVGNLMAMAAARMTGARVLTRSDSNAELLGDKPQSLGKSIYVKTFFAGCSAMLVSGERNREFYRYWGVPEAKLVDAPFTVDNDRFAADGTIGEAERAALRASWGCSDNRPVMVFASKFMARKQPLMTMQAALQLAREGVKLHLVMVGSGDQDRELRDFAAAHPELPVHFTGFVNQGQMPALLAGSDVFVFPSTGEPWGLIVNEAMAVGLPVVVGERCGCVPDLVREGENGFLVGDGDLAGLTHAMRALATDPGLRARMAQASRDIIAHWGLAETAQGVREACGLPRIRA